MKFISLLCLRVLISWIAAKPRTGNGAGRRGRLGLSALCVATQTLTAPGAMCACPNPLTSTRQAPWPVAHRRIPAPGSVTPRHGVARYPLAGSQRHQPWARPRTKGPCQGIGGWPPSRTGWTEVLQGQSQNLVEISVIDNLSIVLGASTPPQFQ